MNNLEKYTKTANYRFIILYWKIKWLRINVKSTFYQNKTILVGNTETIIIRIPKKSEKFKVYQWINLFPEI